MADEDGAEARDTPTAMSRLAKLYVDEEPIAFLPETGENPMKDQALAYFSENDPEKRKPNQTLKMLDSVLAAYFTVKQRQIADWMLSASQQGSAIDATLGDAQMKLTDMSGRLNKFYDSISEPHKALDAFKASIREELKLQDARKLWTDSAATARSAYAVSWIVLIALLLVVPAYAISQYQAIIGFFHQVSAGIFQDIPPGTSDTVALISAVSRLFLITVPIAMYLWLVRIVVRFNMRSLLLMDDARQRNTMLETYLHLVERDAEVKVDRALILEALFRRTPGHGSDTIEPPNLADIMKMGHPAK
ncbi:DUF6161 domain-containing protein [Mesorhizobium sp. M0522]|uniref:DUF6161 domain-containing protein n=1 Tax=Mesorhizobium sp. M0522 TaxID=2956958 RepID=UPI00333C7422